MKIFIKILSKRGVVLFSLGCLLGLHAYKKGKCLYCGKKDPNY